MHFYFFGDDRLNKKQGLRLETYQLVINQSFLTPELRSQYYGMGLSICLSSTLVGRSAQSTKTEIISYNLCRLVL
ncbi:hypothetical protein EB796_015281 [Bugula neritina]|uniref:Uncharacterized protein n=1 Tax=Bugula neritina TaxID=10212 RepID=A0A7J7JKN1_BUGNE|nr:hypothetical protein EB796_015281 [Bugula neritina]